MGAVDNWFMCFCVGVSRYVSSIVMYVMPRNNAFVCQFHLLIRIPVLSAIGSDEARKAVPTGKFRYFSGSTYSIPEINKL